MINHLIAIGCAYIIDQIIGDPPDWPHPVKMFGRMIAWFDRRFNCGNYRRLNGLLMVCFLIIVVFAVSLGIVYLSYRIHPWLGIGVEAILIATTIAQKGLKDAALAVVTPLKCGDFPAAREQLSHIVGRDTDHLDEAEIVRGTVETVAENISDGITAPLFWAFIGGAPLALVYRLINTCDSMVGYTNKTYNHFGWASAKIDDIVNYIPARLTGLVIMTVKKPVHTSYRKAWTIVRRDVRKHTSPNSGWGEAPVASILGIQLGGINYYQGEQSIRNTMGSAFEPLSIKHIYQTITVMRRTVFIFLVMLILGGLAIETTITWIESTIRL